MENNKRENSEEMSVNELVNRLKDNISSVDGEENSSAPAEKSIAKKSDPDKDIVSMLKKFMPEDDDSESDFELDEISENDVEVSDFELETEDESSDVAVDDFEFDAEEEDVFIESELEEPSYDSEEFISEDVEDVVEDVDFESEEILEPENEFDTPKMSKLAQGYAKMLELESREEMSESVSDIAEDEPEEAQLTFDDEIDNIFESSEEDMESVDSVAEEDEIYEDEAPVVPEMIVLDDNVKDPAPEEDYFEAEKNPLAFDDEDEAPMLPDESAFEDVGPSDISWLDTDLPIEELAQEAGVEAEDVDAEALDSEEDEAEAISEEVSDELDDKDINLMIALGYEEELEKAIGKKELDEISNQLNEEIVDFIDIDSAYAFDGFEIDSPDQFRSVGNRYKQEHSTMKMRLLGTGIFTVALFIFELLGMFGVTLGGALNIHHYPVVGIMLSLQMLVLACALSWRQLLVGLYDAVTFNPSPNSLPSVAVLMSVLYNIIMALIAPNTGLWLYNFPAALSVMFLVLNDYFNLSREIRAFNTIATRRPKYAVSVKETNKERSVEEEMLNAFSEDEQAFEQEKILETKKVGFIENYFQRTNVRSMKDRKLNFVIFPFIALSIVLGIVSFVMNKNGITAFNISILTVFFGIPMSSLFIYSYPFFNAVKTSFENEATIIGEASIDEYSDATDVVFSDNDVFPAHLTVTRGIKLYDNNAIYNVLYYLTSLYSKVGGPLKERLEQATTEMGHSEEVEITRVADKGIEAIIDGNVNVLAGQAEFMYENNIFVENDLDDERMKEEGISVLYLVLDGKLSAKLYVNYAIDPEFENVVSDLAEEGMETFIRTCDPNVDDELLASKLRISRFPAKIIKCSAEENNCEVESADSGIVSRTSLKALARAIALCNKIQRVRKTSRTVSKVSMIVSLLLMVFLALFSSKLAVSSIYVALYQVFWMVPMFLFTKLYVK